MDEVLIELPVTSCYDQIRAPIQTSERVAMEAKYLSDVLEPSLARPKSEPDDDGPVVNPEVVRATIACL